MRATIYGGVIIITQEIQQTHDIKDKLDVIDVIGKDASLNHIENDKYTGTILAGVELNADDTER